MCADSLGHLAFIGVSHLAATAAEGSFCSQAFRIWLQLAPPHPPRVLVSWLVGPGACGHSSLHHRAQALFPWHVHGPVDLQSSGVWRLHSCLGSCQVLFGPE